MEAWMSGVEFGRCAGALAVVWVCGSAGGQSLVDRRPTAPEANENGVVVARSTDGTMGLLEASVTAIEPPEPRTFEEQDLVTIIISERSEIEREQTLETEKSYSAGGEFAALPDPLRLLELRYDNFERLPQEFDATAEFSHDGEGTYERDDSVTARVTGRVVEVKPNGTLLIESKTSVLTDGEEQVIVLSGLCRQEDITIANTVQSNQMANLVVKFDHSGDIKRSADKGWIPRVIETLFNF
jgi:flagellar L-ring protein precursor FlgH